MLVGALDLIVETVVLGARFGVEGFAGFAGLGLGGVALPPLMARSTGMSLLAFASIVFPPAFTDLLVLGISTSLQFDPDPAQAYNVMRMRDIIRRAPFRLSFQSVNGLE